MTISCLQSPLFSVMNSSSFSKNPEKYLCKFGKDLSFSKGMRIGAGGGESRRRGKVIVCGGWLLPVDPWAPTIDSESIASQLFAASLFPYLGFLYFITKSKSAPKLTLFGFYFLLAFVGATIPAGIYAKVHYGTSLSNVDWLHGGAESLLTLTNLFIVLGLRQALRGTSDRANGESSPIQEIKEENRSSV
uniref:WRKY transcription factor n=1 Tax=Rhizophora mucronata TaxID=61149 RepID=A0A2P2KF70_RHIMU